MKSGDASSADRAILRHIARYRLSFKEIIGHLFCAGGDPQKSLDGLRERNLIRVEKGYGGNRSAYQLTPKGAKLANSKRRRADPLGSDSLPLSMAMLSFCFLRNRPRLKLEEKELEELLGGNLPNSRPHCLERSTNATRIYHMYVPDDGVRINDIIATTKAHIHEALQSPALENWLTQEVYAHAILVDSGHREAELKAALDEALVDDEVRLREVAHIHIETVPGFENLGEALRVLE